MGEQGISEAAEPTGAPEFSPQQIAGAVSKLISATIGDAVTIVPFTDQLDYCVVTFSGGAT